MITKDQIALLCKKLKTNEATVVREYLQVWFLSRFYSFPKSEKIFFKGGTAIHLLFGAPRFSEDLDFTVQLKTKEFSDFLNIVFKTISNEEEVEFKERKTLAGKRFLLTANPTVVRYKTFINLDFSFREKVLSPAKSIAKTDYPILFTSYVYHLSKEEILAEKVRAVITRERGRDLYDLWFLLNAKTAVNPRLIKEKLKYYNLGDIKKEEIIKKVEKFSLEKFVLDLRPFVPISEREKLADLFVYLKDYLKQSLTGYFPT